MDVKSAQFLDRTCSITCYDLTLNDEFIACTAKGSIDC